MSCFHLWLQLGAGQVLFLSTQAIVPWCFPLEELGQAPQILGKDWPLLGSRNAAAQGTWNQPLCPGISPRHFGQQTLGIGCSTCSMIFLEMFSYRCSLLAGCLSPKGLQVCSSLFCTLHHVPHPYFVSSVRFYQPIQPYTIPQLLLSASCSVFQPFSWCSGTMTMTVGHSSKVRGVSIEVIRSFSTLMF